VIRFGQNQNLASPKTIDGYVDRPARGVTSRPKQILHGTIWNSSFCYQVEAWNWICSSL